MSEYKCDTCNKLFNRKFNLDRHKNKKFPCSKMNHFDGFQNRLYKGDPFRAQTSFEINNFKINIYIIILCLKHTIIKTC